MDLDVYRRDFGAAPGRPARAHRRRRRLAARRDHARVPLADRFGEHPDAARTRGAAESRSLLAARALRDRRGRGGSEPGAGRRRGRRAPAPARLGLRVHRRRRTSSRRSPSSSGVATGRTSRSSRGSPRGSATSRPAASCSRPRPGSPARPTITRSQHARSHRSHGARAPLARPRCDARRRRLRRLQLRPAPDRRGAGHHERPGADQHRGAGLLAARVGATHHLSDRDRAGGVCRGSRTRARFRATASRR